MQEKKKIRERVIVYIDGFNLYFGMMNSGFTDCRWLNLNQLAKKLLREDQELVKVKYFTSRINNSPEKQKRQSNYIDALESLEVEIRYGNYQDNLEECIRCGHSWKKSKEKMTDVNIATSILVDAFNDEFDMAMLISGDSDLVPPIKSIHSIFQNKRVLVAFPPSRQNVSMKNVSKGAINIGRKTLLNSQFTETVISKSGYPLTRPESWKKNS